MRSIVPLILVPTDQADSLNDGYAAALDAAVGEASAWWATTLGTAPFVATATLVIGGAQPRSAYTAAPTTEDMVQAELAPYYPELAGTGGTDNLYVVYALLGMDPYSCPGDVLGARNAIGGQLPVLIVQSQGSLDAFLTGSNAADPNTGSRACQVGALAHELGHALGLQHPTDPADQAVSIMYSWWLFPNVSLSTTEQLGIEGGT